MVADGQTRSIQSEKRREWTKVVGLVLGKVEVDRGWSVMVGFVRRMARVGRHIRSDRFWLRNIHCWLG